MIIELKSLFSMGPKLSKIYRNRLTTSRIYLGINTYCMPASLILYFKMDQMVWLKPWMLPIWNADNRIWHWLPIGDFVLMAGITLGSIPAGNGREWLQFRKGGKGVSPW